MFPQVFIDWQCIILKYFYTSEIRRLIHTLWNNPEKVATFWQRPGGKTKIKHSWVFEFQKYGKFWKALLGHFIKHKPFKSEECFTTWQFAIVIKTNGKKFTREFFGRFFLKKIALLSNYYLKYFFALLIFKIAKFHTITYSNSLI